MDKSNFYITLPSNSSMEYYPRNTLSKYITKLHRRIVLDKGEWEVALVEMQYPSHFETDTSAEMWIQYSVALGDDYYEMRTFKLPKSIYDNEESLAEKVNRGLKNFELRFQKHMNRFVIVYDTKSISSVILSNFMGQLLGFCLPDLSKLDGQMSLPNIRVDDFIISTNYVTHHNVTVAGAVFKDTYAFSEAPYPPKLTCCAPTHMYIYTDIIEPNLVGDCIAPLLRIIKVQKQTEDPNISISFTNPFYLPVIRREFDTIEINIRDDEGHLIPFVSGKLNMRLHFRRVQNGF